MSEKANEIANEAVRQTKTLQGEIATLRRQHEHLERVVRGLLELLQAKSDFDENELAEIVRRIKEDETVYGGVVFKEAAACPKCYRPLQENSDSCIYCGDSVERHGLF